MKQLPTSFSTSRVHSDPFLFFPVLRSHLVDRTTTNFFQGSPLTALTTLSFSDNVDLQRSAALAFAEITEKEVRPVGRDTLDPILFLLSSQDTEVQRAASAALGNLAVNSTFCSCFLHPAHADDTPSADNKLLIVKLGGLEPLIKQMLSPNVEVQCNAVGCVTNLATHGVYMRLYRLSLMVPIHVQMTTRQRSQSPAPLFPSLASRVPKICEFNAMLLVLSSI